MKAQLAAAVSSPAMNGPIMWTFMSRSEKNLGSRR